MNLPAGGAPRSQGRLLPREGDPITLSVGEQQRVAIARAIVHRLAVLLADDPIGNLDAEHARELGELFRSFHQVGVTVVIATHDAELAQRLGSRVIALRNGELAREPPPA